MAKTYRKIPKWVERKDYSLTTKQRKKYHKQLYSQAKKYKGDLPK